MARIELLYFDGCPGYAALLDRLPGLVGDVGAVELRSVASPEEAEAERFLGSPTLRVDGLDVEPGAADRTDYGLKCRLYRTPRGQSCTPSDDWIQAAVEATDRAT